MAKRDQRERKGAEQRRETGEPGGGQGRKDEVGGSGVYPASGPGAPDGAEIRTQAAWGQGERGAAGYEDSGQSELFFSEVELNAAERAEAEDVSEPGKQKKTRDENP